jgi:hypothetical protein
MFSAKNFAIQFLGRALKRCADPLENRVRKPRRPENP